MTKINLNRHLKAALVTLALTVGVFSIGSLVKGSDDPSFANCTQAEFSNPRALSAHVIETNKVLNIRVDAGSCDGKLDNINTTLSSNLKSANRLSSHADVQPTVDSSGKYFSVAWRLRETESTKLVSLSAEIEQVSPTGARRSYEAVVSFYLNVYPSATKPCPEPALVSPTPPGNSTVSSTQTIRIGSNEAHIRRLFAVTKDGNVLQSQGTDSRSMTWDTTKGPNGTYVIYYSTECGPGYTSSSGNHALVLAVNNPPQSASSPTTTQNQETPETVVFTTSTGEQIKVKPQLLAQPEYRATISAPKNEQIKIQAASPVIVDSKVQKIEFKGAAKPNTKYQLMVFSEPKELDFTTDSSGSWSVELKDSLEPGEHEAYVVLNDTNGKPVERSSVLSFIVPTAEAAAAAQPQTIKQTAAIRARYYAAYSGVVILAAMLAFFGYQGIRRRLKANQEPAEPETPTGA